MIQNSLGRPYLSAFHTNKSSLLEDNFGKSVVGQQVAVQVTLSSMVAIVSLPIQSSRLRQFV